MLFSWKFYIFWKYWDMFWSHGIVFHQNFNKVTPDLFSISSNMAVCRCSRKLNRGVFRIQSNMCDGSFLRKELTAFIRSLFSPKSTIVDIRVGYKYVSAEDLSVFRPIFAKLFGNEKTQKLSQKTKFPSTELAPE